MIRHISERGFDEHRSGAGWYRTFISILWKEVNIMLKHEFIKVSLREIEKNIQEAEKKLNISMITYSLKENKQVVFVEDELILDNFHIFNDGFNSHWFCIRNVDKGLNYYGVTLIMAEDLNDFLKTLKSVERHSTIRELIELTKLAIKNKENIVHFGV